MLHAFVIVIILKGLNEMILTTLTFERKKIKIKNQHFNGGCFNFMAYSVVVHKMDSQFPKFLLMDSFISLKKI
jgi:hypothetical protein